MYVCVYVCICVCMYVTMCMYVCMYVCVCYVSMHISDSLYRVAIAARRPFTKIQQSSCSFITMMDRIKLFPNLKTLINAEESTYMWNTRQDIFSVLISSYTSRLLSKDFYRKKVKDNMFICSK